MGCMCTHMFPVSVEIVDSEDNIKEVEERLSFLLVFTNTPRKSITLQTFQTPNHCQKRSLLFSNESMRYKLLQLSKYVCSSPQPRTCPVCFLWSFTFSVFALRFYSTGRCYKSPALSTSLPSIGEDQVTQQTADTSYNKPLLFTSS